MVTRKIVPLAQLLAIGDRAARYRRVQVANRASAFELEQEITCMPVAGPIDIGDDGWAKVGTVCDGPEGLYMAVWWHQETDRVRLERPPERKIPAAPPPAAPPVYRTDPSSTKSMRRPFTATPGYVFVYEGVEYDHEAAEWLLAEQGSMDGWTWRKV